MSGIFPNHLKIAKVTLIYKKDDKKIITNYRPISVLPVVSKVFETVIHDELSDYFLRQPISTVKISQDTYKLLYRFS